MGPASPTLAGSFPLFSHVPGGPKTRHHVVPGPHHVAVQTADPIRPCVDVVHMGVRDARPVATDAACVAVGLILEPRRRSKVQVRESPRFRNACLKIR